MGEGQEQIQRVYLLDRRGKEIFPSLGEKKSKHSGGVRSHRGEGFQGPKGRVGGITIAGSG